MATHQEYRIRVMCENPQCLRHGQTINTITAFHSDVGREDIDALLESWGQGSEDDTDYCPMCNELGVPHEEIVQDPNIPDIGDISTCSKCGIAVYDIDRVAHEAQCVGETDG